MAGTITRALLRSSVSFVFDNGALFERAGAGITSSLHFQQSRQKSYARGPYMPFRPSAWRQIKKWGISTQLMTPGGHEHIWKKVIDDAETISNYDHQRFRKMPEHIRPSDMGAYYRRKYKKKIFRHTGHSQHDYMWPELLPKNSIPKFDNS